MTTKLADTAPVLSFAASPAHGAQRVDLATLLETRLLVQGSSGSGKTTLLYQVAQETHGRVQQIIIDKEGEFAKLREKYAYLLVGSEGEVPLDLRRGAVETLLRRVLELGADVIYDLSDLVPHEQHAYVARMAHWIAHLSIRDPIANGSRIVIIDEIQHFAPESGRGNADSTVPLVEMAALSRKRGFCLLAATTRLSHVSKSLSEIMDNSLIGRAGTNDSKRAADVLDFDKHGRRDLLTLPTHHFYAYGPAFGNPDPVLVRSNADDLAVRPRRHGESRVTRPKPPASVAAMVEALGDLPTMAAEEIVTIDEAKKEITKLRTALTKAQKGAPAPPDTATIEKAVKQALGARDRDYATRMRKVAVGLGEIAQLLTLSADILGSARAMWPALGELVSADLPAPVVVRSPNGHAPAQARSAPPRRIERTTASFDRSSTNGDDALPRGEHAILTAAAQYPDGVTREQLTVLTGYKRSSRDTYVQRLQARGLVSVLANGAIAATDDGVATLGDAFEPLPTGVDLRVYWLNRLPLGEQTILKELLDAYPDSIDRGELSARTSYKRSSRDTYLQRLGSRKLVTSDASGVRASDTLFDEAGAL